MDYLDLQGVMSIKRIYIDRGNWPTNPIPVDYGHEDLGKYYGAVAHSINLNENVLRRIYSVKRATINRGLYNWSQIFIPPWIP